MARLQPAPRRHPTSTTWRRCCPSIRCGHGCSTPRQWARRHRLHRPRATVFGLPGRCMVRVARIRLPRERADRSAPARRFQGSDRQVRGRIMALLRNASEPVASEAALAAAAEGGVRDELQPRRIRLVSLERAAHRGRRTRSAALDDSADLRRWTRPVRLPSLVSQIARRKGRLAQQRSPSIKEISCLQRPQSTKFPFSTPIRTPQIP